MPVVLFGINKFIRKTEKQKALVKRKASELNRNFARKVLRDLVLQAPQYSGNTAAAWTLVVAGKTGTADGGYTRLYSDDWTELSGSEVQFRGDMEAWKVALERNLDALKAIRYNSTITIKNTSPGAGVLASMSPDEVSKNLRLGNYLSSTDVFGVNYITAKYHVFSNNSAVQVKTAFG